MLFGRTPTDGLEHKLVGEIRKAGDRAAALTRQLLAFGRQQVLAPKVLDLNAAVIDLEKMLRRIIGEDVQLATDLQPGLGRVKADPGQLEQVLLNLAVNARDAMPQGGTPTLTTRDVDLDDAFARGRADVRPGAYVRLAVSDTGGGMTPQVKAHIFEPFFTTKEKGKGTGLGLATVYGIVKQSGGFIEVDSAPGRGATFRIYLPRIAEPAAARKSHPDLAAAPRGHETVLLVEDEDAVRSLSRLVLRMSGYTVLEAGHGEEALAVAEQYAGPTDLLVSDVVMPRMSGRQLAEVLARRHPGLKVLFLSGYTDDAIVRHGVSQAHVNFLQKPFASSALVQKVRAVLDG